MALIPIDPNHDDSPWYRIMEEKGKVWDKLADEVGARTNGLYNAYIVWEKRTH